MQFKIGSLAAVGALFLGAQLWRGWHAETKAVAQSKSATKTKARASTFVDGVRVLSFAESQAEHKHEAVAAKKSQTSARANWVRVLPGGKLPVSNGLTRSDNDWKIVPGRSRFGGTQLVLGRGYQSHSVATLKNHRLEVECIPAGATKGVIDSH